MLYQTNVSFELFLICDVYYLPSFGDLDGVRDGDIEGYFDGELDVHVTNTSKVPLVPSVA